MFNQECKKISYANHLKELQSEKDAYMRLYEKFTELKSSCDLSKQRIASLLKKIKDIDAQLKRSHFEVELSKSRKCPPQQKCLPYIDYNKCPAQKTINDYDIQTHKDFYKYVAKTTFSEQSLEKTVNRQLRQKLTDLRKELDACQNEFNVANNNIGSCQEMSSKTNVYESFHNLETPLQDVTVCKMSSTNRKLLRPLTNSQYDVTKHKDFKRIIANMMLKSDCAVPKDELIKYTTIDECNKKVSNMMFKSDCVLPKDECNKKISNMMFKSDCGLPKNELIKYTTVDECNKRIATHDKKIRGEFVERYAKNYKCSDFNQLPIEKHPQYNSLMKKYFVPSTVCQTKLKDYPINQHPDFKNYLSKSKVKQLIQSMPIEKHPQYQSIMSKYALRDTATCPPVYKPCNLKIDSNGKVSNQFGDHVVYQSPDGKILYKFNSNGHMIKVFNGKETQLEGLTAKHSINDYDITTHRNYAKIMEKYALRDTKTCPPTYKPCKTLDQYNINEHPDINKYVLKSKIPQCSNNKHGNHKEDMVNLCKQHFVNLKRTHNK